MNVLAALLIFLPLSAFATETTSISEVGAHVKLFIFEKSENPQNILVGFTKMDANCHFLRDGEKPLLDYYWMMNREKYKAVNALIKSEVRRRLQVAEAKVDAKSVDRFGLRVQDFNGLSGDLAGEKITVASKKTPQGCEAAVELSNDAKSEKPMKVDVIAAESKRILLPPFRKFISLKFIGADLKTGVAETRVIR